MAEAERRQKMKRITKAILIAVLTAFVILLCVIGIGLFRNWSLGQKVRSTFSIRGAYISAEEIQRFLDNKFPPGTPKKEIEKFLTAHFGRTDWPVTTLSPGQQSLSYMVDCGCQAFGTHDFMLLEFLFSDTNVLQEAKVGDRSVSM